MTYQHRARNAQIMCFIAILATPLIMYTTVHVAIDVFASPAVTSVIALCLLTTASTSALLCAIFFHDVWKANKRMATALSNIVRPRRV